jgi:hypothetical protein
MDETGYYAVVTWGNPGKHLRTTRDRQRAIAAANAAIGRGNCSKARVYRCDSAALARSADISVIRCGETVIYST